MFLFAFNTVCSQLVLKYGLSRLRGPDGLPRGLDFVWAAFCSHYVILAIALQGVGFILWMFVVVRVKLGIAFSISGAFFYVLIAASSWMLFGEQLTAPQWLGLILITAGVVLMTFNVA